MWKKWKKMKKWVFLKKKWKKMTACKKMKKNEIFVKNEKKWKKWKKMTTWHPVILAHF